MVISDTVSAILKEDTFVSYPNQDLASGLDQCRELPDEAYLKILKKMKLPEAEPSGYPLEENSISSFTKTLGFHTFLFYPRGRASENSLD